MKPETRALGDERPKAISASLVRRPLRLIPKEMLPAFTASRRQKSTLRLCFANSVCHLDFDQLDDLLVLLLPRSRTPGAAQCIARSLSRYAVDYRYPDFSATTRQMQAARATPLPPPDRGPDHPRLATLIAPSTSVGQAFQPYCCSGWESLTYDWKPLFRACPASPAPCHRTASARGPASSPPGFSGCPPVASSVAGRRCCQLAPRAGPSGGRE